MTDVSTVKAQKLPSGVENKSEDSLERSIASLTTVGAKLPSIHERTRMRHFLDAVSLSLLFASDATDSAARK